MNKTHNNLLYDKEKNLKLFQQRRQPQQKKTTRTSPHERYFKIKRKIILIVQPILYDTHRHTQTQLMF